MAQRVSLNAVVWSKYRVTQKSANVNNSLILTGMLLLTTGASLKHWGHVSESHTRHGRLCLVYVCLVLCAAGGLVSGWSPVHGTLPTVYSSASQPFFFSLPYPLIRLFIYEYPLSSLPPPIPQKEFFFLIFLGQLTNETTPVNLMTFMGFYFWFCVLQFISIFYNSSLSQDQNK
jgi:hypothetical protein